jgi:hypothetical protein
VFTGEVTLNVWTIYPSLVLEVKTNFDDGFNVLAKFMEFTTRS